VNRGQRGAVGTVAALVGGFVLVLGASALVLPAAGAAGSNRVVLPQAAPALPHGTTRLGGAPAGQTLQLDVILAGRNPSGLAQTVAAVSTPGSPGYRQYLTPAQFASAFGPSAAELAQVSSVLRAEGLTVGQPLEGSVLLPVSGSVAAVESAFGTTMQSVQAPGEEAALVNTSAPSVPASLSGLVTGVAGLNGLDQEHNMLKVAPGQPVAAPPGSPGNQTPAATTPSAGGGPGQAERSNAQTPQACDSANAAAASHPGAFTSTTMANVFGLNQMFGEGRTGLGQTIAVVEFEQYLASDFTTFQSCYGLANPIRNVAVNGGSGGPGAGSDGEAALDVEFAAVNAPSASLVVYEAPNTNDADALDLFQRIASDDSAQVVTTSWGNCEQVIGSSDIDAENGIFSQMAAQGQTVLAASGDSGSEDCFPDNPGSTGLAVDDPGSQPNVVSVGGTKMTSASAGAQSVWNNCQNDAPSCAFKHGVGATGGGYSALWPRNPGQPTASGSSVNPCGGGANGCRSVPDIAFPGDPQNGALVSYWGGGWTAFGGTSIDSPTTAGYLSDTNQGCASTLGPVGPALYESTNSSDFTDITSGNNDVTDTNSGLFPATTGKNVADATTGLGSPVDPKLALALQGGAGCPSVAALSPNTGPISGSGPVTVFGGGFATATSVTFGSAGPATIVARTATTLTVIPPNALGARCVDVTVGNPLGVSATSPFEHYGYGGDLNCGQGYSFVASDGGIFDYGSAGFFGSMGGRPLNQPVVGMATTPTTNGYWEVASDGGIFAFGDAGFFGSMGGRPLNRPIVGLASTPDGKGYWEVASDGGIFAFGDAGFFGSMGGRPLNEPIVGIASTPDGKGYWEVASDGGIFAFGDAGFFGSMGGRPLNEPIVGIGAAPNGGGYWMVASDGGIFDFGAAGFFGSAGGIQLNRPVVGMSPTPDGGGYWLVASDGGIFSYGDASFLGSAGSLHLNAPIVGMSST
jgi:Pro-kumamolisin, activation domain/IPT/TIG domain